ncbi:hypothetical protein [Paenibacillus residui]|uniref:Uncharacterized protein n=1 Tax=Paenibacillus residui TaxID=629724 RepID=A0ABW3D5R1_9BACL
MYLKLIDTKSDSVGFSNRHGHITEQKYECPCGKGVVAYEIDDITGFKNWDIYCDCKNCSDKYHFKRGGIAEEK